MSFAHRERSFTRGTLLLPVLLFLLSLLPLASGAHAQTGPIPGLGAEDDYACYYGPLNPAVVHDLQLFDLVILHPGADPTPAQIADVRDGLDDVSGTEDDVLVVMYITIGEDDTDPPAAGDGTGPVYWDGSQVLATNGGYASYYLDDEDRDDQPDENGFWGSYYVNAGDANWWAVVQQKADRVMQVLGADGFFLDTIDTASPWSSYGWTAEGMANLIAEIRGWYPDALLVANRGLFYFNPSNSAYQYNIRPLINGVMFEDYYTEWEGGAGVVSPYFADNRDTWAPVLHAEGDLADGFTVFILDYLNLDQPDYDQMLSSQLAAVNAQAGWLNHISALSLDQVRFDTFHHHAVDDN
ncbi:MAG TPA: hypothetical protein ENI92_07755, partial [Bacteroidetes bacterium]|nr:hypothetical protein [Bacteroidota bacterium]